MNKSLIVAGAAALFAGISVQAAPHPLGLDENQPYGILSDKYVTPHVKWAKPYAGKKLRVLVLAPISTQRETVELAQRMDIEFDGWMTQDFKEMEKSGSSDFCSAFFCAPGSVMTAALKQKLQSRHDVYVVGKIFWDIIPADSRIKILERVAGGAGLVIINPLKTHPELDIIKKQPAIPGGAEYVSSAVPAEALAPFKMAKNEIKALSFGKGRVVIMDFGETIRSYQDSKRFFMPSLTPIWDNTDKQIHWQETDSESMILKVPYEYAMVQVARAVLWSGKNENKTPVNVSMSGKIPAGKAASFRMEKPFKAAVRDLRAAGIRMDLGSSNQIPALPCGQYMLDVWKLDAQGKIVNWKTVPFTAVSDVEVSSVKLDKLQYESGEKVTGTITFKGTKPAVKDISVVMFDNLERQVSLPGIVKLNADGTVKFTVQPMKADVPLHKIRVNVSKNGAIVANKDYMFPVRTKPRHRFVEVAWGSWHNSPFCHFMIEKLKKDDATDVLMIVWSGASSAYNVARGNANSLLYGARYGVFGKTKDHIHKVRNRADCGCMNNPNVLKATRKTMNRFVKVHGPYAPAGYTHGDETFYSTDPSSCRCQYCLAKLRNYLKKKFVTIEKLNAAYKTDYKTFEEIDPPVYEEAKKSGKYGLWLAHREMAAVTLHDFFRATQDYLREAGDPTAQAGFDGIQGPGKPNSGLNIPYLSGTLENLNVYTYGNTSLTRLLGDFTKKNFMTGGWYGSYGDSNVIGHNNVPAANIFPYFMLLNGLNSSWFWTMGYAGGVSGFAGDMTSLPYVDARTESLKEIHTGIGDMILDSEKTTDGIAICYEDQSRILEALFSKDALGTKWVDADANIRTALEDSGYAFRYVLAAQLKNAVRNYKAIILPRCHILSDENIALLKSFAAKGGLLIADIIPGEYDEFGNKRASSPLAELFKSGKNAVLIGDMLNGYRNQRTDKVCWKNKVPLKGWKLREILKKAGIEPRFKVSSVDGKQFPQPTVYSFANGNVQYVGLLRDYWLIDTGTYKLKMTMPSSAYVYDSRAGKFMGKGKSVVFSQDYHTVLFTLLPGKVGKVSLNHAGNVKAGETVKVKVSMEMAEGKLPDAGAYRLLVYAPSGKLLTEYERSASAKLGKAELEFRTAFNQNPGKYRLVVRDAATGVRTESFVEVK